MLYNDVVQQTCDPGTGVCTDSPDTWVTSKQFYAGERSAVTLQLGWRGGGRAGGWLTVRVGWQVWHVYHAHAKLCGCSSVPFLPPQWCCRGPCRAVPPYPSPLATRTLPCTHIHTLTVPTLSFRVCACAFTRLLPRRPTGLGVVQALPGPLFNFSAYLGAIIAMNAGYSFVVGAVLAWFGLFAPGILIIFGECGHSIRPASCRSRIHV